MTNGHDEQNPRRWTAKRRAALVIDILRGSTTVVEAARAQGLTVAEIEQWKKRFLTGAENALRSKPLDEEALTEQEIKRLKQKVGELVMDLDILKEATKANPFGRQMFDEYVQPYRLPRSDTSVPSLRFRVQRCMHTPHVIQYARRNVW